MSASDAAADVVTRIRGAGPRTIAFWVLGVVSWGYLFIATGGELLQVTVWSIPFVLVIGVVSTPWRSVSWPNILLFFFVGMGPVYVLTLLLQWALNLGPVEELMRSLLADSGIVFVDRVIWAPVTEELTKVAPLVILALWTTTGFRTLAGPIDYAVIAGATGAGFAFAEDISVHVAQGFLHGPTSSIFALNLGPVYQDLVGSRPGAFDSDYANLMSFFFPEMQYLNGTIWAGHGALALALGLSIGIIVWARRQIRSRLLFAIPVITYMWVVWEHMIANWSGARCGRESSLLCTLADVDLQGRIFPFVILAGLGFGAYLSGRAIRYYRNQDDSLRSDGFTREAYQTDGIRGIISFLRDWFAFRRWRRKAAYGFDRVLRSQRTAWDLQVVLAARWRASYIRRRLTGKERVPIPADMNRRIEAFTPLE